MTRPFIEFVQCQTLPWQRGLYGGARADVEVRMLSIDNETGASSVLVRYPPGWERNQPERLSADEEFLVLRGHLKIGEVTYGPYGYAHLPSGFERESASSSVGALVVAFYSAEPSLSSRAIGQKDKARSIIKVDGLTDPYTGNFHPTFPVGAGRKFLKQDPKNGEETWLLGTLPLRSGRKPERHPVVEELFLVSGSLVGPLGTMYPGAYFWRPPEEWHGPFGTLTGNVELFRTIGGPLKTEYTEYDVEFCWNPEYHPIVPGEQDQIERDYRDRLADFAALTTDSLEKG